MMHNEIETTMRRDIQSIANCVAKRTFKCHGIDLELDSSEELMNAALNDYPANFIDVPDSFWNYAEVIQETGHPRWTIRVSLWTAEEGRSDMSIEIHCELENDGTMKYRLHGIAVF